VVPGMALAVYTRMQLRPILLALTLSVAGCARTVVRPHEVATAGEPRPAKIVVYDFAVTADEATPPEGVSLPVSQTPTSQRDVKIGRDVANALAERLARDLRDQGFVVERRPRGTSAGAQELAIDGEFVHVDEGDTAKRLVVGFGVGASRVETQVHVSYDHRKLLEFGTHSDSGKMPGAAASLGAGVVYEGAVTTTMLASSAATGTYKEYHSEVERMSAHSAEQAARYLSQYFGKQGWIAADRVKKAKIDD
jgi:Domain of unknown function (DUF4410)